MSTRKQNQNVNIRLSREPKLSTTLLFPTMEIQAILKVK